MLNDVLSIFRQLGLAHRGAWEKVTPSIEWDKLKTIRLDISIDTKKH